MELTDEIAVVEGDVDIGDRLRSHFSAGRWRTSAQDVLT